jgi:hypothetical protein
MQSLAIRASLAMNLAEGGRIGKVFGYRYHATHITTPRQARNTLAYVLRGSIKTMIDERSRSGDLEMCLSSPLSLLARLAVAHVATPSRALRPIGVANSTA